MFDKKENTFMTNRQAFAVLLVAFLWLVGMSESKASSVACEITYTTQDETVDEYRRKIRKFSGMQNKTDLYQACEEYGRYFLKDYPFNKIRTIKIELM